MSAPEPGFRLTTVAELIAEPEDAVEWVIDELVPAGGMVLVVARAKVGKSTFVRSLALAVARGDRYLDRAVTAGTAVYLGLEERRSGVREHFRRMGATDDDPLLIHVGAAPLHALDALRKTIEQHRPIVAVIDPLLRFTRVKDASAYAEMSNALEPVVEAARQSGCCLIATHHGAKDLREGAESPLGSVAIGGAPDTIINLQRRPDGIRTIETSQRYGPDLERQVLALDGVSGRVNLAGRISVVQQGINQQRVRELLASGDVMTTDEMRETLDLRKAAVLDALGALVKQGVVVQDGRGVKGDPRTYHIATGNSGNSGNGFQDSVSIPIPTQGVGEQNPFGESRSDQNADLFRSQPPGSREIHEEQAGTESESQMSPIAARVEQILGSNPDPDPRFWPEPLRSAIAAEKERRTNALAGEAAS
jgi:hypothetical protein